MNLKHILAMAPLALGMTYGCEGEETAPQITKPNVEYYTVNGSDCEEAKNDIFDEENGKGFMEGGKRRAGKADVGLSYVGTGYKPIPQDSANPKEFCCKAVIDPLVAVCEGTVYLPQWDGNDKCWDRFIEALTAHEQGHVDLCMDYAGRLKTALTGLESDVCSTESMQKACDDALTDLEQKAGDAYDAVDSDYNTADDLYDSTTDHGETQGAVLDCDCE
ncbi:MAG: DUF922 domain-containing protein [Nanoarchaeota archaeon]|nr:DUF922 domain-containing protein [Nanoarchaeota archaeon]